MHAVSTTPLGPRYTVHDGFACRWASPSQAFDSGQRYRAAPGDIFVTSYPKCGTTWVQYIVYLLEHDGRPLAAGQRLDDVFPHLEEVGEEPVRALPRAAADQDAPAVRAHAVERAGEVRVRRAQSVRLRGVVLSPHARLRAALRFRRRRRGRRSSIASCAARSTSAITSTICSRGGRSARSRTCCS